jgi:hypothetical protein
MFLLANILANLFLALFGKRVLGIFREKPQILYPKFGAFFQTKFGLSFFRPKIWVILFFDWGCALLPKKCLDF